MAGNAATVFSQLHTQIHREMWCQIGQLKELWCRSLLECSLLLSRLYTPLFLSLSHSFFYFPYSFSQQAGAQGRINQCMEQKKIFPIVIGKKWCVMNHDDNCTILLQTCYRWKWDAVFFANKSFICVKKGLPQNEHSVIIYSSQLCDFLLWNKKTRYFEKCLRKVKTGWLPTTNILQNIFCIPQEKEIHRGLELKYE